MQATKSKSDSILQEMHTLNAQNTLHKTLYSYFQIKLLFYTPVIHQVHNIVCVCMCTCACVCVCVCVCSFWHSRNEAIVSATIKNVVYQNHNIQTHVLFFSLNWRE